MRNLYFILPERRKKAITVFLFMIGLFIFLPGISNAQGIQVFNYVSKIGGHITSSQENLDVLPEQEIEYILELRNVSTETFSGSVIEVSVPYYANFHSLDVVYYQGTIGTAPVYVPGDNVIRWNLSSVPGLGTDDLLAKLTYTLVSSHDCYALNSTCEKEITVTGSFTGTGSTSGSVTAPFVYGYRNVIQTPTTTPVKITIDASAFVADCNNADQQYRQYVYLEDLTSGATIPVSDISSNYPSGSKYYDTINTTTGLPVTGSVEYTSTGFPKSAGKGSYYAVSPSNCWQKFFINVLDTSDIVFCAGETMDKAVVWASDWDAVKSNSGNWYLGTEMVSNLSARELALADTNKILTYQAQFVCDNSSITSNGVKIIVHDKPTITKFDPDTSYCVGQGFSAEVEVTANDDYVTYQWTFGGVVIGGNDASVTFSSLAITDNGKYLKVVITNSCGFVSDSVKINVYANPEFTFADPTPVCYPSTVNLENLTILSGSITGLTLAYYNSDYSPVSNTIISGVQDASYHIIGETVNGCLDTSTVRVIIYEKPEFAFSNPAPVCYPSTIDLKALTKASGDTIGLTLAYYNSAYTLLSSTVISGVQDADYHIIGTTSNGCSDTSTVRVTIYTKPEFTFANPTPVCDPFTVDLTGLTLSSGSIAGLTLTYYSSDYTELSSTTISGVQDTIYHIIGKTADECSDTSTVRVIINTKPEFSFANPTPVCDPFTIDLKNLVVSAGDTVGLTLTYYNSAYTLLSNTVISGVQDADYHIIGETINGCSDTSTVRVTIYRKPEFSFANPSAVCDPFTIDLKNLVVSTGDTVGLKLTYYNSAYTLLSNTVISGVQDADYHVIGETINGCSDTSTVRIIINAKPEFSFADPSAVCYPLTVDLKELTVSSGDTIGLTLAYYSADYSPVSNTVISGVQNASYHIIGTTANGCSDTSTVTVIIKALPVVSITGADSICVGIVTQLSPTANGVWQSSNTAIATVDNAGEVTGVSAGRVVFTYTDNTTQCSSTTDSVTIKPLPIVSIIGSSSICIGTQTQLSPSEGGTWVSNNPSVASVTNDGFVTGIAIGSATFTFTSSTTGCSNTTSAVSVGTFPVIDAITAQRNAVCADATIQLSCATIGGVWTLSNTNAQIVGSSGDNPVQIKGVTTGQTYVSYTVGTGMCQSTSTFLLKIVPATPPEIIIGFER